MVSKRCSEVNNDTQREPERAHCMAFGRQIRNDGWAELDYLDYMIRKQSKR